MRRPRTPWRGATAGTARRWQSTRRTRTVLPDSRVRPPQACESSERPTTPLRYSIEGLNAEVKKLEESARMHLIQRRRTSRRSRGFSRQASRTSLDEQMAHPAPNLHGSTACHASRANTGTSSLTSLAII
eukprot:scaffold1134_cov295-Prasinococcus_capsulatus_cf.AAC.5